MCKLKIFNKRILHVTWYVIALFTAIILHFIKKKSASKWDFMIRELYDKNHGSIKSQRNFFSKLLIAS